jgi:hypothetical protein
VTETHYPAPLGERLIERLPQDQTEILYKMMRITIDVTLCIDCDVEASVAR